MSENIEHDIDLPWHIIYIKLRSSSCTSLRRSFWTSQVPRWQLPSSKLVMIHLMYQSDWFFFLLGCYPLKAGRVRAVRIALVITTLPSFIKAAPGKSQPAPCLNSTMFEMSWSYAKKIL